MDIIRGNVYTIGRVIYGIGISLHSYEEEYLLDYEKKLSILGKLCYDRW